jgi:hypothetical protein
MARPERLGTERQQAIWDLVKVRIEVTLAVVSRRPIHVVVREIVPIPDLPRGRI